ncbi:MAG: family hydrolase, partial [Dehalococcoidia bacterium]|nr:family hydrolase [Dehalococcoidia bacterium]
MQLAIDTSSDYAGLALAQDGKVIGEITWKAGPNHTTQLLPALTSLLHLVKAKPSDLTSIAVAIGPGSYNGLRAGLSTAKGFAFALGIPIVGVGTLEVAAYQHHSGGLPICALHNAGREEIAAARYQWQDGRWCELQAHHLTTIALLSRTIDQPTVFCGELNEDMDSQLKTH